MRDCNKCAYCSFGDMECGYGPGCWKDNPDARLEAEEYAKMDIFIKQKKASKRNEQRNLYVEQEFGIRPSLEGEILCKTDR